MYPDSLPLMEELEGQKKLPTFCKLMDKQTQVGTRRLSRPFPDPLYRTVVQTPMTSSITSRMTETITPIQVQRKTTKPNNNEPEVYAIVKTIGMSKDDH